MDCGPVVVVARSRSSGQGLGRGCCKRQESGPGIPCSSNPWTPTGMGASMMDRSRPKSDSWEGPEGFGWFHLASGLIPARDRSARAIIQNGVVPSLGGLQQLWLFLVV